MPQDINKRIAQVRGDNPVAGPPNPPTHEKNVDMWRGMYRAEMEKRGIKQGSFVIFESEENFEIGTDSCDDSIGLEFSNDTHVSEIFDSREVVIYNNGVNTSSLKCLKKGDDFCYDLSEYKNWNFGFHSDIFGEIVRSGLPDLSTDYVLLKGNWKYTPQGELISKPKVLEVSDLKNERRGIFWKSDINTLRQLSYTIPKDRRGRVLGTQIYLLKEVAKGFAKLPEPSYLDKLQNCLYQIENYFDRQTSYYRELKEVKSLEVPEFYSKEALDTLFFFEYKSEKDRIRDNIREFPGGSGEVKQEKFVPPINNRSNPAQGLIIGSEVHHPVFGIGTLLGHDKSRVVYERGQIKNFGDIILEVEFDVGKKRILAKFCELKKPGQTSKKG